MIAPLRSKTKKKEADQSFFFAIEGSSFFFARLRWLAHRLPWQPADAGSRPLAVRRWSMTPWKEKPAVEMPFTGGWRRMERIPALCCEVRSARRTRVSLKGASAVQGLLRRPCIAPSRFIYFSLFPFFFLQRVLFHLVKESVGRRCAERPWRTTLDDDGR